MMTLDQVMTAILAICPDAIFDQDESGELIVSTGLRIGPDDMVSPLPRDK
jgi:hypothetical protein